MLITLSMWPPRRRPNTTGSRTAPKPFLVNSQWVLIKDLLRDPPRSKLGGRPRVAPRACLEGILWVLKTGARWQDLPERYPSPSTCWRRLEEWTAAGVWENAWRRLLKKLDALNQIDWEEAMGDGTFSPAKKKGADVGKTKKGKGTKIMLMIDGNGTPLSAFTLSANHAEVNALENLVDTRVTKKKPKRILYDKAADADWVRERLVRGIELICPHRRGRKKPPTQDGRPLRRYKRKYKVERTISWLFNLRRLVVRYEYHDYLFEGFVQLGCLFTILQRF